MNERIIKAGLDSGMLNYVDHETPRHYFLASWATEEDLEKFAELIMNETFNVVVKSQRGHMNPKTARDALKEHFGVE